MAISESEKTTINIDDKRFYKISDKVKYPSVTTIIGEFSDKSFLVEWKKRIGSERAEEITRFSSNRGDIMHQMIEYFLSSTKKTKRERLLDSQHKIIEYVKKSDYTDSELNIGRKLFYNFYNARFFDKIKRVIKLEETLYSSINGGYAGRVDFIYLDYDDNIIIADFKTSRKPKKREWISNYFKQIAAYFLGYWQLSGNKPNGGEIWISNEADNQPQIHKLNLTEIKSYLKDFLGLVKQFHIKYPNI